MVGIDSQQFETAKQATLYKWRRLKEDLADWREKMQTPCGFCHLIRRHKQWCLECPAQHLCHKDGSYMDKIRNCSRELDALVVQLLEELGQLKGDG